MAELELEINRFILINADNARAADVRGLIDHIQKTVQKETGYALQTEIGFIGEFDAPTVVG